MANSVKAGTLQSLRLTNFTAFADAQLDFSPGLNVFLGANGTGKTHAMKALYALAKIASSGGALHSRFRPEFAAVFGIQESDAAEFGLRRSGAGACRVRLASSSWIAEIEDEAGGAAASFRQKSRRGTRRPLFLPSRETLAMFEGFVSAWQKRELAFDQTYFDACIALGSNRLKGKALRDSERLGRLAQGLLQGTVSLRGSRFYVSREEGTFEAQLVSDGLRKIAMLSQLIANGSLAAETILFWDEPESALNPSWVTRMADLLVDLSSQGVQVFVSTHDYLLAHRLSLLSEYGVHPEAGIRFHSFQRPDEASGVDVGSGATLSELRDTSLVQEFAEHYEFEQRLFAGEQLRVTPYGRGKAK